MKRLISFLKLIAVSKIALLGAGLVTSCVIADVLLILGELFLFQSHPYMGIFTYMMLPGMVMLGLMMIPAGIALVVKRGGEGFSRAGLDRLIAARNLNLMYVIQVVFGLSMLNLVILSFVGYRGFHYTESKEFCGELCHEVMHPELTAYSRSPHSEVECVECHIGSGAGWFIKSKLSGARQVLAVARNDFSRPIQTPIHNLRPARDVCEVCHRPETFHGNVLKTIQHFASDETNSRSYTVLNMRVGSGGERGVARGIHWHVSREHELRYYATDHRREDVVWVELTHPDGTRTVWTRPDSEFTETGLDRESLRLMDCVDCHNRPTHIFLPMGRALDEWLEEGKLDRSVPWIRKVAQEVLAGPYASSEEAMDSIARVTEIYRERYPEVWEQRQAAIEASVAPLQDIHRVFVYPEMKIQWDTYPSLIGHPTPATAACFRCHNGVLRDDRGRPITVECDACHYVLADHETNPEILRTLVNEF